jgi:hypothetical protein
MIKFVLTFALLVSSTAVPASSNWLVVGAAGEIVFSIETNSIQKSGDSITFWTRRNYGTRQKDNSLSTREQITINCRVRDSTFRFFQSFDGNDNGGKVLATLELNSKWQPIAPDSIMWSFYEFVCKK